MESSTLTTSIIHHPPDSLWFLLPECSRGFSNYQHILPHHNVNSPRPDVSSCDVGSVRHVRHKLRRPPGKENPCGAVHDGRTVWKHDQRLWNSCWYWREYFFVYNRIFNDPLMRIRKNDENWLTNENDTPANSQNSELKTRTLINRSSTVFDFHWLSSSSLTY